MKFYLDFPIDRVVNEKYIRREYKKAVQTGFLSDNHTDTVEMAKSLNRIEWITLSTVIES